MKYFKEVFLIITLVVLSGCEEEPGVDTPDDCDIPNLSWSSVKEGYDSKAVIEIASSLSAVAKVNAGKIKVLDEGAASAELKAGLSKVINNASTKEAKVSREFFEAAKKYRIQMCVLTQSLDKGRLKSQAARDMAEIKLIEFSTSFGEIKSEEEKKTIK
ncbi:hypothetical protein [Oceanospirillum beijerinckii]|uniref:hypothetical protein n=1 Tax=Oceanospirillum beijerinckii TaxID=64976 RepID=UPI00048629E4|nr:hypothetical protein [Oceanospirillum beijerinckii]